MLINKLWKTALIQAESGMAVNDAGITGIRHAASKLKQVTSVFPNPQPFVNRPTLLCINHVSFLHGLFIFCGQFVLRDQCRRVWSEKPSFFSCTFTFGGWPVRREFSPGSVYTRMLRTGMNVGGALLQPVDRFVNKRVYPEGKIDFSNLTEDYPRIHIPNSNRYLL